MFVAGEMNATVWPSPLIAGRSETLFACVPPSEMLRSDVPGAQELVVEVADPSQVFRTKIFSKPFVVAGTKFVASEAKAMNCPSLALATVELMLGCSLKPLPGVTLSLAIETSVTTECNPTQPRRKCRARRSAACHPMRSAPDSSRWRRTLRSGHPR